MKDKLKKREIIKNIAIVFLVIMLILTFFSNTIMNRTLPEVKTQGITSGTVSMQVRGEGIVEAEDPYNVTIDETRKVKSVLKHEGDRVEVGDVIYKLEGESGEELTTAKNDLAKLQSDYDKFLIGSGLSNSEIKQVEDGVKTATATIISKLEKMDKEIAEAQKKVDDLTLQSKTTTESTPDTTSEQRTVDKAQEEYDSANATLTTYNAYISDYNDKKKAYEDAVKVVEYYENTLGDTTSTEHNDAVTDRDNKEKAMNIASCLKPSDSDYTVAKKNVENKKTALENAKRKKEDKEKTSNTQNISSELEKATTHLKELTDAREKYYNEESKKIELEENYQNLLSAQKKVEELEKKAIGGEIKSPVAGTVSSVALAAGEKTEPGTPVAVIQLDGKGYKLQFPVDAKQAKAVKVGDEVTIVNSWYYGDVSANLVAIQPNKENKRDGKILVFSLNGSSINPGQSLTLSVGQKSSNYDLIVPLAALRGDNDGNFVYILENKATPFGSRYIAKRVDVEVLAKDDKVAAINADLNGWEYVITNSSKDLENKDQVKLAE
jgi:multidrug efflux pump subunit AcrA (membrane-fusion protein)